MKTTAWRIIREKHLNSAFTGEGAKVWGGRWNPIGLPAVYCAANLSLAILEIIVHLEDDSGIDSYVAIPVSFESKLVQSIPASKLPKAWNDLPIDPASVSVGQKWLEEEKYPILKVPSIIVPIESDFVLNPLQPAFKTIEIGNHQSIHFDQRFSR